MKVRKLLIGLAIFFVALLVVSPRILSEASLDVHLYDGYYIFYGGYVVVFCLMVTIVNIVAYKLLGYRHKILNSWISYLQVICTLIFFGLLFWFCIEQQHLEDLAPSKIVWIIISLVLSVLLLAVHFVIPGRKLK